MATIEIKNLSKTFYVPKKRGKPARSQLALSQVSLSIKNGSFLVLMGDSGSGKTTLLRILAGVESFDEGDIFWNGLDATTITQAEKNMSYVAQNYILYPYRTVYQNIAMGLKGFALSTDEIIARIREAAQWTGIEDVLTRKPRQLSGGQQQRVAIARALAREADVNLFDEPLSNVDPAERASFLRLFQNAKKRRNATFVYCTHRIEEALALGDEVALLKEGRIVALGTPREIFDDPSSYAAFSFAHAGGFASFLAEAKGGRVSFDSASFPLPLPDGRYRLCFRYEQSHLAAGGAGFLAAVEGISWDDGGCRVEYRTSSGLRGKVGGDPSLSIGDSIRVEVEEGAFYVFDAERGSRIRY